MRAIGNHQLRFLGTNMKNAVAVVGACIAMLSIGSAIAQQTDLPPRLQLDSSKASGRSPEFIDFNTPAARQEAMRKPVLTELAHKRCTERLLDINRQQVKLNAAINRSNKAYAELVQKRKQLDVDAKASKTPSDHGAIAKRGEQLNVEIADNNRAAVEQQKAIAAFVKAANDLNGDCANRRHAGGIVDAAHGLNLK
jgi:hypothetical protein